MCAHTASRGRARSMAARIAVLPRPSSTCPLGGEWTTSTHAGGTPASRSSASSSSRSKLQSHGVTGIPPPSPKNVVPSICAASPCRTVAASQPSTAARSSSSVSLLPGTSTVGLSIGRRAAIVSSSPLCTEAKSPAPTTRSAWLAIRTSSSACPRSRCTSLKARIRTVGKVPLEVMPAVLDVEQSLLLLEIDPPFDQRAVQLARRRLAKRWHPDLAPPGKQVEHERHLQAINRAADQLESLAEGSRGGSVSAYAVRASAAAARKAREEAGRRAYEAEQQARAREADRQRHDPFGDRVPDHSVVHRYARCVSYPEWGVGNVTGIYFSGEGDDVQQWARVRFSVGVRTVPAGSLQFVDFSKPDPGADRVQRFMTAAQHAMAEGNYGLAAQRLIYARDAEPTNVPVLRLMTLAFWQAGNLPAAGRAVRAWARVDGDRPTPHRYAARIYEDMRAIPLAAEAAERAAECGPGDASAWERLGRLRLAQLDGHGAIPPLERARLIEPSLAGLLDLALAHHLAGEVGTEVSVCEEAIRLAPASGPAWARFAHALART